MTARLPMSIIVVELKPFNIDRQACCPGSNPGPSIVPARPGPSMHKIMCTANQSFAKHPVQSPDDWASDRRVIDV
jgi:hypothetical protein